MIILNNGGIIGVLNNQDNPDLSIFKIKDDDYYIL